jgi:hypothetical protein
MKHFLRRNITFNGGSPVCNINEIDILLVNRVVGFIGSIGLVIGILIFIKASVILSKKRPGKHTKSDIIRGELLSLLGAVLSTSNG